MHWCTVSDNGRVLSVGTCPDNTLEEAFTHMTDSVILGCPGNLTNEYYYSNGVFTQMPPTPGPDYYFDFDIKAYTLDLAGYKDSASKQINSIKEDKLQEGVLFNSRYIAIDPNSVAALNAAINAANNDSYSFSIDWITNDNSVLSISKSDLPSLSSVVWSKLTTIANTCRALKDAILVATTKEEVDLVQWP